jgi:hypothetical protein
MRILKTFKQVLLHEASIKSLSRIWQHTKESNIGMITAYRGEFDVRTNDSRNQKLAAELRSNGFGYIQVTGFYIENLGQEDEKPVTEKTFFVTSYANDNDKLKNFLVKMGAKYNQDSIFYKAADSEQATLIGTTAGRWSGLKTVVNVGKFVPQKLGMYYTKMKGDRKFTFESIEYPEGLMSKAYRQKLDGSK